MSPIELLVGGTRTQRGAGYHDRPWRVQRKASFNDRSGSRLGVVAHGRVNRQILNFPGSPPGSKVERDATRDPAGSSRALVAPIHFEKDPRDPCIGTQRDLLTLDFERRPAHAEAQSRFQDCLGTSRAQREVRDLNTRTRFNPLVQLQKILLLRWGEITQPPAQTFDDPPDLSLGLGGGQSDEAQAQRK